MGRAFDNSIRVDVEGVSRYHAIIEQKADGFWLSDLGSRNGTTVNGTAVSEERKLENGDSLVLGGVASLEFRLTREQSSAEGAHGRGSAANDRQSPAKENSTSRRALMMGLVIVAVVIGAFVLAVHAFRLQVFFVMAGFFYVSKMVSRRAATRSARSIGRPVISM